MLAVQRIRAGLGGRYLNLLYYPPFECSQMDSRPNFERQCHHVDYQFACSDQ